MASNFGHTIPTRSWSSRLYETASDLQQMYSLLMEARARTSDWRYSHAGELAFNFFMVACHLNPRKHTVRDKNGCAFGGNLRRVSSGFPPSRDRAR